LKHSYINVSPFWILHKEPAKINKLLVIILSCKPAVNTKVLQVSCQL